MEHEAIVHSDIVSAVIVLCSGFMEYGLECVFLLFSWLHVGLRVLEFFFFWFFLS